MMKKEYTKPVIIVTAFDSQDATNGLFTSGVTSFKDVDKSKFNVVEF